MRDRTRADRHGLVPNYRPVREVTSRYEFCSVRRWMDLIPSTGIFLVARLSHHAMNLIDIGALVCFVKFSKSLLDGTRVIRSGMGTWPWKLDRDYVSCRSNGSSRDPPLVMPFHTENVWKPAADEIADIPLITTSVILYGTVLSFSFDEKKKKNK